MENLFIIAIVAAIIVTTAIYLIRVKRRGGKCVGCPYACKCNHSCEK